MAVDSARRLAASASEGRQPAGLPALGRTIRTFRRAPAGTPSEKESTFPQSAVDSRREGNHMIRILGAASVFALYVGLMFALAASPSFFPTDAPDELAASDEAVVVTQ